MNRIKELNVLFHNRKVGKMKLFKNYFAAFEYDKEWLLDGFAINPFSLPLKQQVFIFLVKHKMTWMLQKIYQN